MIPNIDNQTKGFEFQLGGKGINVSIALNNLGLASKVLGFGSGFTLDYIKKILTKKGIYFKFIKIPGTTSINFHSRCISQNCEYSLTNPSPKIYPAEINKFLKLLSNLKKDDIVLISGGLFPKILSYFLEKIAYKVKRVKALLIVNINCKKILDILKFKPFLLKLNEDEIKDMFEISKKIDLKRLVFLARKLINKGAQNILLSLGHKGALLVNKNYVYYGNAPRVKVLNPRGSSEVMLGTFVYGIIKNINFKESLLESIAAASDNVRFKKITDFKNVWKLENKIKIKVIFSKDIKEKSLSY